MTEPEVDCNEPRITRRRMMTGGAETVASFASHLAAGPLFAGPETPDKQVKELRTVMRQSNQKIRMKPGTYVVKDTLKDDNKTVFRCTGSNNRFDLRGVTIQVPTQVLANMSNAGAANTRIRNVQLEGILRRGKDIYSEEDGPAAEYDYNIYYPSQRHRTGERYPSSDHPDPLLQ